MKRLIIFLLVCIAFARFPLITGCANMVPPSGGPKDSLPPVLVRAVPDEYSLHMTSKRIVLTFDEYVDLKDLRKNLIVSPVPKITPTVRSHLKTVTIELRDSLIPNTTYYLDFGRALVDVDEGNVYKNFFYVFSTGDYIDSLEYSGRVIMAYTGKADTTLVAMLHTSLQDSAVVKEKPKYIARLDSMGSFTFHHIRPATYALYALKDESGQYEYTSKAETFAFAANAVNLKRSLEPELLYAYQDTSDFKRSKKKAVVAPLSKKEQKEKEKTKRLVLSGNISNNLLSLHNQLEISFATPLKYYDSSKIRFTNDSFQNITNFYYTLDSLKKKLTFTYPWKENTGYHLILQKDFAEDTLGEKLLKIDTISFRTKKESDYGNLRLRFRNLDLTRHPVLLFFQGDKLILSAPIGRSYRYNNKLFDPGEYQLRILYDTNQNGVWDPGDFFQYRQPEIAVPIRKKLTVKSDWDNEVDINM